MTEIFLIAGEPSGDALGADIIRALRAAAPRRVHFTGVGGPLMRAAGMTVTLDAGDLGVMGLAEVLPQLPRLMRLGAEVRADIIARRPAVVVTIDFPDFNFRLARTLRKRAPDIPIVHIVAPTVWAWRPGRAKAIARFLDAVACLLPFEPPYFEAHGLRAPYIGHPVMAPGHPLRTADGAAFRAAHALAPDTPLLGLFAGSRAGEVARHLTPLVEAAVYLREEVEGLHVIAPTLPAFEFEVTQALGRAGLPAIVTTDPAAKWGAMRAMNAAVAVSGTVGLELAAAGTPHVVTYRTSWLTWRVARMLARVRHVHLANLVLGADVVPELLQKACEGEALAEAVAPLLTDPRAAKAQRDAFAALRARFARPLADAQDDPPAAAARVIWGLVS
jgi:lipid-A-disaccharide synthase